LYITIMYLLGENCHATVIARNVVTWQSQ
jgi:hypothetical protein